MQSESGDGAPPRKRPHIQLPSLSEACFQLNACAKLQVPLGSMVRLVSL